MSTDLNDARARSDSSRVASSLRLGLRSGTVSLMWFSISFSIYLFRDGRLNHHHHRYENDVRMDAAGEPVWLGWWWRSEACERDWPSESERNFLLDLNSTACGIISSVKVRRLIGRWGHFWGFISTAMTEEKEDSEDSVSSGTTYLLGWPIFPPQLGVFLNGSSSWFNLDQRWEHWSSISTTYSSKPVR